MRDLDLRYLVPLSLPLSSLLAPLWPNNYSLGKDNVLVPLSDGVRDGVLFLFLCSSDGLLLDVLRIEL